MHRLVCATKAHRFAIIFIPLLFTTNIALGQSTKFEKYRQWSDSSGNFNTRAIIVSANQESVTIRSEAGKSITVPFDRLSKEDRKFAADFNKTVFSDLKTKAKRQVFAVDALRLYREFAASGFLDETNRVFVESQVEVLTAQARINAIALPDGFVSEDDWSARKTEASDLISEWFRQTESGKEKRQDLLRLATTKDPSSTEGAIILALIREARESKFTVAQRQLEGAIKGATKYLPIATDTDRANLVVAMNNLAVSYARSNRISKAVKLWTHANEMAEYSLPSAAKYNLAKVHRMIQNDKSGLSTSRPNTNQIEELVVKTESEGTVGGWRLMAPLDSAGASRENLSFVVDSIAGLRVYGAGTIELNAGRAGVFIEDARCVKCGGTNQLRCPNKLCHGGAVKTPIYGPKYITFPDGTRHAAGYGIIRHDQLKCPTCKGHNSIVCPYCTDGIQKN